MRTVRVVFSKWGDRPHWEYDGRLLGEDEHGRWVGAPAGTRVSRPGAGYDAPTDFVSLLAPGGAFVASFYREHPGARGFPAVELYVDITTVPAWDVDPDGSGTVRMVDLDLDVVRGHTGRVWVDDEDEFADHRTRFGYPAEIVHLATTTCERVHADVSAGRGPFAREVGRRWLSRLAATASA